MQETPYSDKHAIAVILMGVTGCGKTTIGRVLERRLGWPLLDGDDYHSPDNVAKMAAGIPLTDADRWPWLQTLATEIGRHLDRGQSCLLACSALKQAYREVLRAGRPANQVRFVHLHGTEALIASRLRRRVHRYMPASLLCSQFEALERPEDAVTVEVDGTPHQVADRVAAAVGPAARHHRVDDWELVHSQELADYHITRVRRDRRRSPRTGREHDFYVLQMPDWVNVIAVTPQARVVVIEQYRHGVQTVGVEIPGGVVDPQDVGDLAAAARRELLEETGYEAAEVRHIGSVAPNPAIQDNRLHTFVALGAQPSGRQRLDAAEDIAVREVDLAAVEGLIAQGRMHHALVVAGFWWFERWRGDHADLLARHLKP